MNIFRVNAAVAAVTMLGVSQLASAAASQVFSFPNGFAGASAAVRAAWAAGFSGSAVNLTDITTEHQAGGAWYTTPQNISSFTTDFTFQIAPASANSASTQGISFTVQNSNSSTDPGDYGTNATGDANLMGYGTYSFQTPMYNSVAIKFDLSGANGQNNYPSGRIPNATGLYINGGPAGGLVPEIDLNPSGVNLHSGDVMAVHLVYDGSILTMTLRDTATNAQFRTSWPVNIPAIVGGGTAYIGFTGGTIPVVAQKILTWSFSTGYTSRLAAPTFSVASGSYPSAQTVSLSGPSGASIYYTTNGQQPTSSSPKYTGPISVSASEVVQAVAIESGSTDSTVSIANYAIAPAGTPFVNFSNGFANASNLVTVNGAATYNGLAIQLTDSRLGSEAAAAWYVVPVNVNTFTTNFTIQLLNPLANGMTFTIQNQPAASTDTSILSVTGGPNAVANNASGLGYSGSTNMTGGAISGLLSSVAVKFDLYTGTGNSTGLYTNGTIPNTSNLDMTLSGLSLHSGNPLNVTLVYDGTTLAMTITDSKTKATFSKNWTIDIPAVVGGNTAYVGFTAGTGGLSAQQSVLSWTYAPGQSAAMPIPAPPTNLSVR